MYNPPRLITSAAELFLKKVVAGRYYVDRLIGEGSFAWVYHAYERQTGQEVAIKVLHSTEPTAAMRFAREIEVLKALPKNPNVVGLVDHGTTTDGWALLVLEFVDGITLRKGMKRSGALAPGKAVSFLTELCGAFVELHQLGVAHRDVKPDNILLERKGGIKLIDFGLIRDAQGILKLLEQEDPVYHPNIFSQELDQWTVAGTPEYMAPEQFADARIPDIAQGSTDTWSDVFSLGVIFYQLLSGERPYPMRDVPDEELHDEILRYMKWRMSLTDDDYPPCPGINEALDSILRKALRQDPRRRQPDARALIADLFRFDRTGVGVRESDEDKTQMVSIDEVDRHRQVLLSQAQSSQMGHMSERKAFSLHDADEDSDEYDDEDETALDASPEVLEIIQRSSSSLPSGPTGIFFAPEELQDSPIPSRPTMRAIPMNDTEDIPIDIEGFDEESDEISVQASGSVLVSEELGEDDAVTGEPLDFSSDDEVTSESSKKKTMPEIAPLDLRSIFGRTDESGDWQEMTPTTQQAPEEVANLIKKTEESE